ncbi:MAG TPA: anaerobic ribonucleoside-triphosphate reductase activating protein [Clostridiaceae bacterium]|nr:anaerobic ribonucleoside-triphosphate reductase activating protein [Clostridiaceae bacterium]
MEIRVAGIIKESIVDGPGIRYVVFAQGCKRNCPGCHNPQTHSFSGGKLIGVDEILEQIKRNPLLDGVTFSGGEPFEQAEQFAELAQRVHNLNLNVMVYTGYTYEEIIDGAGANPGWKKLLESADILVDGPFIQAEKDYMLRFRGSKNQRIIDLNKTRLAGTVILADM